MNIKIIEDKEALKVTIECIRADEQISRLEAHIELFDYKIQAKRKGEACLVKAADVLYFEAVDNRTFLYTQAEVMEIKQRLYELELVLSHGDFIRISKSQIVNIQKISSLRPEINRTILLTMCNEEQLFVSRKYVKAFRKQLSI
ncbi:MAG: LytTR family transcriptional regulator DNA-binding domain-containing protein [Lachnospiraceae bacterium]|nr:LytTR family transcriptional regulator DNA-binding domain-containing protein [Lachnospiraceae bacterium]